MTILTDKTQISLREQAAQTKQATALAHPNIAFIKYWGNQDNILRLPSNASLSMNLGALHTTTTVSFDDTLTGDMLTINNEATAGAALDL